MERDCHSSLAAPIAVASPPSVERRKPQRRLQPLPADFCPSPPLVASLAASNPSSAAVPAADTVAGPATRSPSSSASLTSALSCRQPALYRSLPSSLPPFRSVRGRRRRAAAASPSLPVAAPASDDDDVVEDEQRGRTRRRQRSSAQTWQCEEKNEVEVDPAALETADGVVIGQTDAGHTQLRGGTNVASGHGSDSETRKRSRSGGRDSKRYIDLTAIAALGLETECRHEVREPLATLAGSAANVRATRRHSRAADSEHSRKRDRYSAAAEDSSALQFIHSVCDAVTAAGQDTQRKRREQRRQERQEVIEVMSEQSTSDNDSDDATVTHIVRRPPQAAHSSQPRCSSPSPLPCVESVKSRQERASLPAYVCSDCQTFHALSHGERAGHFEALCRHRYSQSAHHSTQHTELHSPLRSPAVAPPRAAPLDSSNGGPLHCRQLTYRSAALSHCVLYVRRSPPPASPEHFWDIATPPDPVDAGDGEV